MRVDLSEYRSRFQDGWTDDDIDEVLPAISRMLGQRIVCVWDYVDEIGPGGDSELVIDRRGIACTLPDGLWDLLLDGEGDGLIDPEAGVAVEPGVNLAGVAAWPSHWQACMRLK